MKKLYTVKITFSDFTEGIEQYEANSVEEVVRLFFQEAECLKNYDRRFLLNVIESRLKNKSVLIHMADGLRGVWLINTGGELLDFDGELEAIYGGIVIQTDPHGPRRS